MVHLARRAMATVVVTATSMAGWERHPVFAATGVEEIRRAASILPGYGPPDIEYPPAFCGRWLLTRQLVKIDTPLGPDKAPQDLLTRMQTRLQAASPLTYEVRFLQLSDSDGAIADRAFNAEHMQAALNSVPLSRVSARWDPSRGDGLAYVHCVMAWRAQNPNVLTVADGSGTVTETKVTKRSFETPSAQAFGTSEYARIADAGSSGTMSAVPLIRASRVQVRYRWDPTADAVAVRRIEGLELEQVYDPTATGFADLAGATPVLTAKSRITLERVAASRPPL